MWKSRDSHQVFQLRLAGFRNPRQWLFSLRKELLPPVDCHLHRMYKSFALLHLQNNEFDWLHHRSSKYENRFVLSPNCCRQDRNRPSSKLRESNSKKLKCIQSLSSEKRARQSHIRNQSPEHSVVISMFVITSSSLGKIKATSVKHNAVKPRDVFRLHLTKLIPSSFKVSLLKFSVFI